MSLCVSVYVSVCVCVSVVPGKTSAIAVALPVEVGDRLTIPDLACTPHAISVPHSAHPQYRTVHTHSTTLHTRSTAQCTPTGCLSTA
eukprot:2030784-Rhodomonas_salina.1